MGKLFKLGGDGTSVACLSRPASRTSEIKLGADLPDAGISRGGHHAHLAIEIAVRVSELCMIEDVKEFGFDFKRLRFGNVGSLREADIEVVDPGAMEELAVGIAKGSQRSCFECIGIEESMRWVAWIGQISSNLG